MSGKRDVRLDIRPVIKSPVPDSDSYIWVLQAINPIEDLWRSMPGLFFRTESEALHDFKEKSLLAGYYNFVNSIPTGE